ncbi:MAG: ATP-binding protein [Streptosporangiaceae bacterium]|jgi:anti-sigma regulatory factor (Ser/Thr protein kinase)
MASAARQGDAAEDLASLADASILGRLTIPGRPEHVTEARAFVAKMLGEPEDERCDTAVLLTSELVTNAVVHSHSRLAGGTVTLVVIKVPGGLRIEVTDSGSDVTAPIVKGRAYASDGHGLFLVQSLADQWGYLRNPAGTTSVWFSLRTED